MSKIEISLWGRKIDLPIEYEFFDQEIVSDEQQQALDQFISHPEWLNSTDDAIWNYCEKDLEEESSNYKNNNLFSFIKPENIFVRRDADDLAVVLMCRYKFDPEHGLGIGFYNNGKIKIGKQDAFL